MMDRIITSVSCLLFSSLLTQVANRVTSRCVEMMGGVGFTKEFPVEKFYRDSKIGIKNHHHV